MKNLKAIAEQYLMDEMIEKSHIENIKKEIKELMADIERTESILYSYDDDDDEDSQAYMEWLEDSIFYSNSLIDDCKAELSLYSETT